MVSEGITVDLRSVLRTAIRVVNAAPSEDATILQALRRYRRQHYVAERLAALCVGAAVPKGSKQFGRTVQLRSMLVL